MSSVVQAKRVAISSHTNYRYLSTPEKHQRMKSLHHENRLARLRLERLRAKLEEAIESKGVSMDDDITDDLHKVMEEEEKKAMDGVEQGSFRQLFWSQQKEAAGKRDKRGIRWHPAVIKWCLFLRHQSRSAYSTLRDSGCLFLPSERTLRDYSQAVKSEIGFSAAVDSQLLSAANIHHARSSYVSSSMKLVHPCCRFNGISEEHWKACWAHALGLLGLYLTTQGGHSHYL